MIECSNKNNKDDYYFECRDCGIRVCNICANTENNPDIGLPLKITPKYSDTGVP
jgi:hypothetical protein